MKPVNVVLLICIFFLINLKGQNTKRTKIDLMQGIWEDIMNNDSEKAYTIIRGMRSLNFVYDPSKNDIDFPLNESLEGFQNYDSGNEEFLNVDSLKEDGLYYTVVDLMFVNENGLVKRPNYFTPNYFECDGYIMSINGGQLVEFRKISKLPYEALKKLYYRGGIDNRDYLKEYLDLNVTEIKKENSLLYDEKRQKVVKKLKKGDIVIILQEEGKWIKVEYGEEYTKGWIKKEVIE